MIKTTTQATWAFSVVLTTCMCTTMGFSQEAAPQQQRTRQQLSSDDRPDAPINRMTHVNTGPSALVVPGGPHHDAPKLGFHGSFHYGWGMKVSSVIPGTPAQRMGLEPGDVIVTVNGQAITCHDQWRQMMQQAVWHYDGRVTLKVDNVRARTGYDVPRYAYVTGWLETVHMLAPTNQRRSGSANGRSVATAQGM